jgi:hypothetical protein
VRSELRAPDAALLAVGAPRGTPGSMRPATAFYLRAAAGAYTRGVRCGAAASIGTLYAKRGQHLRSSTSAAPPT